MEITADSSTEKVLSFGCIVTRDESTQRQQNGDKCYSFGQEENKKSSFKLQFDEEERTFQRPCHVFIQTFSSQLPFLLGGFEFVSNSRSIEVYITESDEKKETYLTTCRGVKIPDNDLHFKSLLVIPGGPRSMVRLRLKLLSAQPKGTTNSCIYEMKLKGRLPPAGATIIEQPAATNQGITSRNPADHPPSAIHPLKIVPESAPRPPAPISPSMSVSDISSGLAGISMMVRSTEDRLMGAMKAQFIQQQQMTQQQLYQQHQILLTTLQTMQNTQQQLMSKVADLEAQNTLLQQLLLRHQGEGISNTATVDKSWKEQGAVTTDDKIVEQNITKNDNEKTDILHQTMLEKGDGEDDRPNCHRSPIASSETRPNNSVDVDDIQNSTASPGDQETLNALNNDSKDDEDKPPSRPTRLLKEVNVAADVLEPPDKSSPSNTDDVKDQSNGHATLEDNEKGI
mmetsp:Transcript_17496/g.25876  ORF Transcript_17496/g.25876 Transcript_17496/m.25876 type:complete len:455 (+) Transcript_17496:146-1510(+)|eukprot:CAMPEP_0194219188 /NCGR_PEP_ID=MMETSP0156-20130528/25357_1 /TAXON_ID=33649 /ORGANISM="Thalassionema nitzschioides, Strain L26-B" /LENGTH=454 /DNA_ID=CAMNT_0038948755 /DNA_START=35 /DNA_END=1399 /DNA_ORIENTATION=+